MARTIFERAGGFATVSKVVSAFSDKILDSPLTAQYFAGADMRRIIDHQTKFMATVMGGPTSYSNDSLDRVHARLGISEAAFLETVALLRETLEDAGIDAADVDAVLAEFMSRKNYIVARR